MSSPFVAEIRIFPFNFAPKGWAFCDGQLLSISQNTALFSLLGTYYGGDGKVTFALPNFQGSASMHSDQYGGGGQYPLGSMSGEQAVTLLTSEMPSHNHLVQCNGLPVSTDATSPSGNVPSNAVGKNIYSATASPTASMNPLMVNVTGQSLPHNNLQPYLVLNYCIALQGIYPPRS